jgi:hypothetical protein
MVTTKMDILYVHAGLPKNGSSALQVFFAREEENLLKHSIEYFRTLENDKAKKGHITSGNGAKLSRTMLNEKHEAYYNDSGKLYKEMLTKVKNSKNAIGLLSSEFFALVPPKVIKKWREDLLLLGVKLKFIYYARRQDQFLMSGYMQRVKRHGYTGDASEYLLKSYKSIHFLNYYGYFNEIQSCLGEENLEVFIYELTKNHSNGLIGHFMQVILKKSPKWIANDAVINTSPSPLEIKFMLMANKYMPRMKFSDYIVEDSIKTQRSTKYAQHSIVPNYIVKQILNYFVNQNEMFCNKFCKGKKFPVHLDEKLEQEELVFTAEEVMDIITGFLVRYDKRLLKIEEKLK